MRLSARRWRIVRRTGWRTGWLPAVLADIGEIHRLSSPEKLVSYFGLNQAVFQSASQPARHERISRCDRSHARSMLVQAVWAVVHAPGSLPAFFLRIRYRCGERVAAAATARRLNVVVCYVLSRDELITWQRLALVAHKCWQLQLQARMPSQHGNRIGIAAAPTA